jgi:hypothetical protein
MLKAVSSIATTRLAIHLKGFGIEQAGQRLCRCDFHSETALQTLREHDQESWVLFVDLVKAYDTINNDTVKNAMEILTLGYQKA